MSMAAVAAAKIAAHWLSFGPPLMLAALLAAGLLGIDRETLCAVELGLLIGTPGLAALAVATGALVAGLRGASALAGLVMLPRSEEHTSELQSLMRISYAVFCLKKKKEQRNKQEE